MKRLIVTADDFGLALPVNEAIELAHREGILSATSLMVDASHAPDAVERARRLPTLGVGLHLVVSAGELPADLVRAGFRFFFQRHARRALKQEITAQFEAFEKTGLALDHVNVHNHMQLHPTVSSVVLELAHRFGVRAVRVPSEPPGGRAVNESVRQCGGICALVEFINEVAEETDGLV